ncbi:Cys-Gly metallodipeptidase DUG1 [Orchesella cincta]|uniref:Cys-Gly metallodipeptidase DUG1 n=1 Tax=Orchesella cincta TaxID=48709 RepID=A0A1D2MT84_ORCCI|nr:Cys-Gly metallodipeptidase DUG1 [Orchesella cincta]
MTDVKKTLDDIKSKGADRFNYHLKANYLPLGKGKEGERRNWDFGEKFDEEVFYFPLSQIQMTVRRENGSGGIFREIAVASEYIEDNKSQFISNLKEAVEIPSVSCWAASRPSCFQMVSWTDSKLKGAGFTHGNPSAGESRGGREDPPTSSHFNWLPGE